MVNVSQRMSLVNALLECRTVRDRSTRDAIVRQLSPDIQNMIRRDETPRLDVISIVEICYDCEEGLHDLVEVVRTFETDKSIPFKKVMQVYDQIKDRTEELTPIQGSITRTAGKLTFQSLIQGYCRQIDWNISEIEDNYALLLFQMNSGRSQIVLIRPFDTTLEFSVPSELMYDSLDDFPDELSNALMMRNANSMSGFWTIQQLENQFYYSCMQNAEIDLLNVLHFENIVESLIAECDSFEQLLEDIEEPVDDDVQDEGPNWSNFQF